MILKLLLVLAIVWIALVPPLFTGGACTQEFAEESARIAADQESLRSSAVAREYWRARSVPSAVLAPDQCRKAKPRYLSRCADGPLVIAKVPVKDLVCRVYRDDEIRVLLQYDDRDRLSRLQVDMNPFKSLPIPFTDARLHWAR